MKKSILITGGAGFIGSHIADKLIADGYNVIIIDDESTGHRENVPQAATYIKGDVRVPEQLAQAFAQPIDAVIHIAGQASTIRSFAEPEADLSVNVNGTISVIQQCIAHGVPRLLFASSMTAYGHPDKLPVTEDTPCKPIAYYGITKYSAERYALATGERNDLKTPLNVTAFRMFNVYGDRQRLDNPYQGVMGIFIGNVLREETIQIFGDGDQSRDFVHIDDVAAAWVSAIENPNTYGRVFNLGCGQAISMNDLSATILQTAGLAPADYPFKYGPERPGDQRHMSADLTQIKQQLGWEPQVDLTTGIRRTMEWARTQL